MIVRMAVIGGFSIVLASCITAGQRAGGDDRNVITAAEIELAANSSAYDIVQRLRPHFLQRRGAASIRNPDAAQPIVYVDGMRRGGIDELHRLPGSAVERIEYISPADATTRWGTGHAAGVIAVSTRR